MKGVLKRWGGVIGVLRWSVAVDGGMLPFCTISEEGGREKSAPELALRECDLFLSWPRVDMDVLCGSSLSLVVMSADVFSSGVRDVGESGHLKMKTNEVDIDLLFLGIVMEGWRGHDALIVPATKVDA